MAEEQQHAPSDEPHHPEHAPSDEPQHQQHAPSDEPHHQQHTPSDQPHHQQHAPSDQPHHHLDKMTDNKQYCDHNDKKHRRASGGPRRALCTFLAIFLLLAGVTALVLWLVYRPHKPRFAVVGAAVYNFNVSSSLPPLVSATLQFTVVMRNPNRRVSIYYDRLAAFVAYRNQAITPQVMLPPLYHGRRSTVAMSPVLGGEQPVPVSVEVVNGLAVDEAYGVVGLRVVVQGRLRWKAGVVKTAHYGVYVKCDVLVSLKKGVVGQVPLLRSPASCKVDI